MIVFAFIFNINSNSYSIQRPANLKRNIGSPLLKKLQGSKIRKIPRNKRIEFNFQNKRIFLMKCNDELIIGLLSNSKKFKDFYFEFIENIHKFVRNEEYIKKNDKVSKWLINKINHANSCSIEELTPKS